MPYLNFIDDQSLTTAVLKVLDRAISAKASVTNTFHANVIDPFGALFEAGGFDVSHDEWVRNEQMRQAQKTLQNHVGAFHQNILGSVNGWDNLSVGGNVDLKCDEKKIIAEIKNKHNTVTGAKLINDYESLKNLVMPNSSVYKGYTAYFVNIIPKSPVRFNKPFTPSDKATSAPGSSNEKIRIIDGASFYDLVTGQQNSLEELFNVLPRVISDIQKARYPNMSPKIEGTEFSTYFTKAFGSNLD